MHAATARDGLRRTLKRNRAEAFPVVTPSLYVALQSLCRQAPSGGHRRNDRVSATLSITPHEAADDSPLGERGGPYSYSDSADHRRSCGCRRCQWHRGSHRSPRRTARHRPRPTPPRFGRTRCGKGCLPVQVTTLPVGANVCHRPLFVPVALQRATTRSPSEKAKMASCATGRIAPGSGRRSRCLFPGHENGGGQLAAPSGSRGVTGRTSSPYRPALPAQPSSPRACR